MVDKFFIWDKKSSINGSSADAILNSNKKFRDDTVVFFTDEGMPVMHDFVESLRLKFNMFEESNEIVCQARLSEIIKQQNITHKDQLSLEKQQQEIEALKKQNAELSYLIMQQGGVI